MSNEVYDAQKDTSTPYDDTFRTLLVDCTRLIIPVLLETDLAYVKKVVNLIKENPKVEDLIIARIICGEDKKN